MGQFIQVNGRVLIVTEKVYRFGLMVPSMKVNGEITKLMVREDFGMLMVMSMKETGLKIRLMVMVFTLI